MSKTLVLDPGTTCHFRPSQLGSDYLACKIEGDPLNLTAFAKTVTIAERPPLCSIDEYAHTHAQECRFHASNQTFGCGCPELNNPMLQSAYARSVKGFVLDLAKSKTTITLTFFASGGLKNECELISQILLELESQNWTGKINLQFVDPMYTVSKTQQVKNQSEQLQQNNWGYIGGAAVAGTVGLGCIWGGMKQEEKRKKVFCYVLATLFIGTAIALLTQIQSTENETKKRKVESLTISPDYMGAIKGMMKTIRDRQPPSIKLHSSYFPKAQVCIRDGVSTDGLFGYDIGDSFRDFLSLKDSTLNSMGQAILVGKEGSPGKMGTPFFMRAQGGSGQMHRLDWTRI